MAREYTLHDSAGAPNLRINYQGELNEQQYAAVTAPPGPALVLAGAGAGKTRTLTYRVAWLLEHGVAPERILLLTFTNKAAREMMQRVGDLIGGDPSALWGGTFHSVGSRLLRRHADRLGFRQDFTIADREDTRDLLSACITDAGIDVTAVRFPKPDALADLASLAVNTGRSLRSVLEAGSGQFAGLEGQIEQVLAHFSERKRRAGLMDFDDLLVLWLRLLQEHADVREFYQRRFQWVLVDEYQDTNHLQAALIDLLVAQHRNVIAVGDDSQSIYSWRGADFANIMEFPKRYPGAVMYRIETNYRSTPQILALANAAIAPNTRQFPKELRAVRPAGERPGLVVVPEARDQANFVAQRVLELREEGVPLDEICVLYRSHFHAMELQFELTRRNIPFAITSGIRFFEQAHIKDVAAHLKLVVNPRDELAFKRLARLLPGIGGKGADKLWNAFLADLEPRLATLPPEPTASLSDNDGGGGEAETVPDPGAPQAADHLAVALVAAGRVAPKKSAAAWAQFTATLAQAAAPGLRLAPGGLIRHVLEAGYEDYVEASYENPRNRLEDLEQLAAYADQFPSTAEFLNQLALQTNLEAESSKPTQDDEPRLRLSSVHQAKGLEFRVVFVIMLCDGLFPSHRSLDSLEGLEEERRLFYVAVTRAKDELYLCRPLLRFAQGMESMQPASQFLADLDPSLTEEWKVHVPWSGMGMGMGMGAGGMGWGGRGSGGKARQTPPSRSSDEDEPF
jgi:DNA helicase-2/ATP-dependent DNA helicase PcrA